MWVQSLLNVIYYDRRCGNITLTTRSIESNALTARLTLPYHFPRPLPPTTFKTPFPARCPWEKLSRRMRVPLSIHQFYVERSIVSFTWHIVHEPFCFFHLLADFPLCSSGSAEGGREWRCGSEEGEGDGEGQEGFHETGTDPLHHLRDVCILLDPIRRHHCGWQVSVVNQQGHLFQLLWLTGECSIQHRYH